MRIDACTSALPGTCNPSLVIISCGMGQMLLFVSASGLRISRSVGVESEVPSVARLRFLGTAGRSRTASALPVVVRVFTVEGLLFTGISRFLFFRLTGLESRLRFVISVASSAKPLSTFALAASAAFLLGLPETFGASVISESATARPCCFRSPAAVSSEPSFSV